MESMRCTGPVGRAEAVEMEQRETSHRPAVQEPVLPAPTHSTPLYERVVELRDATIGYGSRTIFEHLDWRVRSGEGWNVTGRNGSGKSTLLKTMYAEVPLLEGEGRVVGMDLRRLRRSDIPYLRRRMGLVFKDYQLLDDRNVFFNLYDVMKATGWRREAEIRRRIDEVLTLVGLDNKAYKMPHELSGGEQQRLTIARALLNAPRLLLADEPTGNLDPVTADGIMRLFHEIAESGCAVIMSTHNTALIEQFPARTILFSKGRIKEIDLERSLEADRSQDVR